MDDDAAKNHWSPTNDVTPNNLYGCCLYLVLESNTGILLTDAGDSPFLKGVRVIVQVAFERSTVQQTHDDAKRDAVEKHVVFFPFGRRTVEGKGADLTSDHGVIGPLILDTQLEFEFEIVVHAGIQSQITDVKRDFNVVANKRHVKLDSRETGQRP